MLRAPAVAHSVLSARPSTELAELFIVSSVELVLADAYGVEILAAAGDKCPRCWNYRALGANQEHPEVCERCAGVLGD